MVTDEQKCSGKYWNLTITPLGNLLGTLVLALGEDKSLVYYIYILITFLNTAVN
jgi:hypothetical protein